MKASEPGADVWKKEARRYFSQYRGVIEKAKMPGQFFVALARCLPANLPSSHAQLLQCLLDSMIVAMTARDGGFCLEPGVSRGIQVLRTKLATGTIPPPTAEELARAASFVDTFARKFLDDTANTREALEWLKAGGKRHTLGELASTAVSVRLANGFYKAGALKVWAVEIMNYSNGQENSGKLVIELSRDAEGRKAVLRLASRKSEAMGFGEITDSGQRYIFLMLD